MWKQCMTFVAAEPKPSGRVSDVRPEQLWKQCMRVVARAKSHFITGKRTTLPDSWPKNDTDWTDCAVSAFITSTSPAMSESFVPSGTATPLAAIASFSAAWAAVTFATFSTKVLMRPPLELCLRHRHSSRSLPSSSSATRLRRRAQREDRLR